MEVISSGAIIFRRESKNILFLLLHYPEGHWDYTKGKIEKGEDPIKAATREIQEETGITNLKFIANFEKEIEYEFRYKDEIIHKKVIFFLAETDVKDVTLSSEHTDYLWLTFEDAFKKTTHVNARNVLVKAHEEILKSGLRL